ncbi:hypothetical protein CB0940_08703 [Cercospora beticola]|uniref:Heterokaryon incompatibility domain-containing protein n=1 Tax=Cercospora beticola TaxID=122368 RepID=A0A2G5HRP0_CERBT|nr:hypothetical protein CB0940_08703 [Cercospora beticola]PIA94963.1 hypothetical protein CB0940_08703 [Cercospora beticola]WPB05284.1 hypothetical protein RHO25_009936 [Cercospora beticola]CAK1365082.1 unnamed protein product [Cercospora beticola]
MAFTYDSVHLPQPKKQIRLLYLQPASDDSDIQARLEVCRLDNCPPFRAISYTWGDQKPEMTLYINGGSCRVRMNCWYALWQMRHHEHSGPLWIDSICIDQSNLEEKNAQVSLMGKIYSKAQSTACCLGPGRNLAHAQRLLRPDQYGNATSSILAADKRLLWELQHRSYFRRTWIKQEIILSKEIHLFCGMDNLDWNTYVKVLNSCSSDDMKLLAQIQWQRPEISDLANDVHMTLVEGRIARHVSIQSPQDVAFLSRKGSTLRPWAELWRLLNQYGGSECQDPRDKVYALLPLLPEQSLMELEFTIDYTLPVLPLCLNMIEGYIKECLTATQTHPVSRTVPDTFWDSMAQMIEHWLHSELSDAAVFDFISRWRTIDEQSMVRAVQPGQLAMSAHSPRFIRMEVWQRLEVLGHTRDLYQEALWDNHHQLVEDESLLPEYSDFIPTYLSDAMTIEQIQRFFERTADFDKWDPELDSSAPHSHGFVFSALPPDLRIKVLIARKDRSGQRFLVSANTAIGDELLLCPSMSQRHGEFLCPIVRPAGKSSQLLSLVDDKTRRSYLAGWAVQLCYDGSLRRSPEMLLGGFEDMHTRAKKRYVSLQRTLHFYMNHQDLILDAILRQDAASYLAYPRTHPKEPSFLEDILHDRTEMAKAEIFSSKKKSRRVGFA